MEFSNPDIYLQSVVVVSIIAISFIGIKYAVITRRHNDKIRTLNYIINTMNLDSISTIERKECNFPLFRAENKLNEVLKEHRALREKLKAKWRAYYANLSWWGKITLDTELEIDDNDELVTTDLDNHIKELESVIAKFNERYCEELQESKAYFNNLKNRSAKRLEELKEVMISKIASVKTTEINYDFVAACWLAELSIPISITSDLMTSHQVYDSLRSVNGNFEGMSDMEIWWETLWMPGEQLAGLVSLTKGAYFESLVADNTGGQLHEYFNHPDTDIVIDGIAYQIKATESVGYIHSIDPEIPVIATSEVAEKTGVINGGYSNEELTQSVEMALGNTVIDVGDTAVDAILTGVGSLGTFATLRGINHAVNEIKKGVDGEYAITEGLTIAVEGTAKGMVDTAELVYKVATSAPSRAVGKGLWTVTKFTGKAIDKALS